MRRLKALLEGPLARAGATLVLALREIFDESAYERFLERSGTRRSRASYRAFLAELREREATRVRCC